MAGLTNAQKAKVNPSSPIFYLKIGNTEITKHNTPRGAQHVVSMSVTESAYGVYSDIVFTLFDDSALLVEYEIQQGFTNVEFYYGMDTTSCCSPRKCFIKDYDIEFTGGGMMLTLQCVGLDQALAGNGIFDETPKVYKGKISDVVHQICDELGYEIGKIVETNDDPNAKETGWQTTGFHVVNFIRQELCTSAMSVDGQSDYVFYVKDIDGKATAFFEPSLRPTVEAYDTYEYVIGKEHENIISFKPEYKGLLSYVVGEGAMQRQGLQDSPVTETTQDTQSSTEETPSTYSRTKDKPIQGEIISAMIGRDVYPKDGGLLKVYTGTNSKECDVVTTLKNQEWADIVAETASWYKVKTYLGKEGWVRKVDVSVGTPGKNFKDENNDNMADEPNEPSNDANDGYTTTPTDTYMTDTNFQNIASKLEKYDMGVIAPSIDNLKNIFIQPYKSDTTFHRYVGSSSYNAEELGKVAEYLFKSSAALMPTAQLELRGNALLDTMSFVLVVVLTKDKLFHHSSGLYQVLEIQHDIDMGEYTSTLNMIKRAMKIGTDGSIELLDVGDAFISNPGLATDNSGGNNPGTGNDGTEIMNGPVIESASSDTIRRYADKYIGLPYIWGGTGPDGYDCSGFVQRVLSDMGYKIPRTTSEIVNYGELVPWDKSQIRPGDCLVYNQNGAGHVVIVVDSETIAHAPGRGKKLEYKKIDWHWDYMQKKNGVIRRYIGYDKYKKG